MSNTLKDMDIKSHAYYFFDNIINVTNFDPNKIKIDEKSKIFLFINKNILIYYIGYVTIKDLKYAEMNSVNPLYLIINKVNGYFEEIIENIYLTLVSTNESRKIKTKKLLIMSKNLRNIAILNIKGTDYHCIIRGI